MVGRVIGVIARALAGTPIAGSVVTVATIDTIELILSLAGRGLIADLAVIKESAIVRQQAQTIEALASARERVAKAIQAENEAAASTRTQRELVKARQRTRALEAMFPTEADAARRQ